MTEQTEHMKDLLMQLRDEYSTVNPIYLIEELGIEVQYVDFLEYPNGLYQKVFDDKVILISEKIETSNKRYFVLAHELHHALEHEDIVSYYTQNSKNRSKIEHEADLFATIVCLNLFIEEYGVESMTKQDLENLYGLPMELSEKYL
ncbi:ImmA/IrrE family metallo-endopeptidase [Marinilactibacillus sp. Marseille-P9653]|uniref:ImmA/IrrE family metallo-endopeptidase n=1 Tax=Marinilactibacillus sp. Marseille-P9653 TaxID=2866583 RepID=UPI001CE484AF|nr:ImmA/IrrE family metallo-endopeptidase [Marinilactibacillus sp. Marseille-P9653]